MFIAVIAKFAVYRDKPRKYHPSAPLQIFTAKLSIFAANHREIRLFSQSRYREIWGFFPL
jgi:hypothetical protein